MGKNEKSVNSNIDRRRVTETEEMNKTEETIENQVKDAVIRDINVRDINAEVKEAEAAAEANEKEIEEKTKKSKKTKKEKAEKKPFKERFQLGLKQMLIYFAIIAGSIIFWEVLLRILMGGIKPVNLFFLFFVPAEAMVLTAINGFFPRKVSRFVFPFTLLLVAVFYGIQLVYFRIFGSLFSISMMGMGTEAVGNFMWAMEEVLIKSAPFLVLLLVPAIATLVFCLRKKIKCDAYPLLLHALALVLGVGFWFAAAEGIVVGGDGRGSAYQAFHSNISDTDTTASRVGTMTTALVEGGTYYFGLNTGSNIQTLAVVDMNNINLTEIDSEAASEKESEKASEKTVKKEEKAKAETTQKTEEKKPYMDERFDFTELAENAQSQELKDMYTYFGQRTPTTTNEYTGLMEGYNLIYICAESYWCYAIDERVTPTLYKMSQNGIILNNYYNSFRNTTTNGEYAFATSLWPDVSRQADQGLDVGSFPQSSARYMPNGLGDFFAKEDVPSYAFHNYYGNYYRRRLSWPNLGYENTYFMGDGMHFTSAWPASDAELMIQSVDKYIEEDRFFAYYMTFSGHGPYNSSNYMYRKNIDEVKRRLGDDATKYTDEVLGYYAGELELEYGMKYLLEELQKAGKLDKTLIVLTGDHYPYYLTENGRNNIAGREIDEMELYKSSCLMYTTGLKEPIVSDTYCCNVDIIPTVLNLFGIDYDSRLFMGTDIFSDGVHKAVLYDKSFFTDKAIYNAKTGNVTWKINPDSYDFKDLNNYIDAMCSLVDSEYAASVNIIKTNFFFHLYKDSKILSEEEARKELNREADVVNTMSRLNEEEQKRREEYAAQQALEAEKAAQEAAQAQEQQANPEQ